MDINENDLLMTNQFIKEPELSGEVPPEFNEEFRKYYKKEIEKRDEKILQKNIEKIVLSEDNDPFEIENTNRFDNQTNIDQTLDKKRVQKEVKTYVSVDSRSRNIKIFPSANYFKIFLGRTFYNVKAVRLVSLEFPNSNSVFNTSNQNVYWKNQEDIENVYVNNFTKEYEIYETAVRTGNYTAYTLKTELETIFNSVSRNVLSTLSSIPNHYFLINTAIETNIIEFISVTLDDLTTDPLSVQSGSTIITVIKTDHGFETGDFATIVNARGALVGIADVNLNGRFQITKLTDNSFTYEAKSAAVLPTAVVQSFGGTGVKIGYDAPYQFLFGEYPDTFANLLGFPIENSSEKIKTDFKMITNFFQYKITTTTPHNFTNTYDYIGKNATVDNATITSLNTLSFKITRIIDNFSFLVDCTDTPDSNSPTETQSRLQLQNPITDGTITVTKDSGDIRLNISYINNYEIPEIKIETYYELLGTTKIRQTPHNFDFNDIGKTIILYNTVTIPSLNGERILASILSPYEFTLRGFINGQNNVPDNEFIRGDHGHMFTSNPIETNVLNVSNVTVSTPGSSILTITTTTSHGLKKGDNIKIYGLVTSPVINSDISDNILTVMEADDTNNTFNVDVSRQIVSINNASFEDTYILTQIIKVTCPFHGFNFIVDIDNIIEANINTNEPAEFILTMQLEHNLILYTKAQYTADTSLPIKYIYVNGTDAIDGRYKAYAYIENGVVSDDKFIIQQITPTTINFDGSKTYTGIITLNQNVFLYKAEDIENNIFSENINNIKFSIRSIIDEHVFTIALPTYPKLTTKGGGSNMWISSLNHGFRAVQSNVQNDKLFRAVSIEGENYVFLCCPQLASMLNTGDVKDIFARITLDRSPGRMTFSFLSNPKDFDVTPLNSLSELEFSIKNFNNTFYDFNKLDYSFVLEITEVLDTIDTFNFSSRRGISNTNYTIPTVVASSSSSTQGVIEGQNM